MEGHIISHPNPLENLEVAIFSPGGPAVGIPAVAATSARDG